MLGLLGGGFLTAAKTRVHRTLLFRPSVVFRSTHPRSRLGVLFGTCFGHPACGRPVGRDEGAT